MMAGDQVLRDARRALSALRASSSARTPGVRGSQLPMGFLGTGTTANVGVGVMADVSLEAGPGLPRSCQAPASPAQSVSPIRLAEKVAASVATCRGGR